MEQHREVRMADRGGWGEAGGRVGGRERWEGEAGRVEGERGRREGGREGGREGEVGG